MGRAWRKAQHLRFGGEMKDPLSFCGEMKKQLNLAMSSDLNVLITGPTGSGKTFLARQIHEAGLRKGKPFVSVNLATLHEGTFESELFGHERGAFTGADHRRLGRLEAANGGTIFLDEIGELPPRLQARLLEFLQSRMIVLVGGNRETRLDVRVIAATNRDLRLAVEKKEFRLDLFHRLQVLSMELSPIASRVDEMDVLVHTLLEEQCRQAGRSILRISADVAKRIEAYPWPGNIRELKNVLEYAVLASTGSDITIDDLPPWFREASQREKRNLQEAQLGVADLPLSLDFQDSLAQFEKEYLRRALHRFRGRINRTAREIGMNKTTLIRRIRTHGLLTVHEDF